jgi:hypothetical protein
MIFEYCDRWFQRLLSSCRRISSREANLKLLNLEHGIKSWKCLLVQTSRRARIVLWIDFFSSPSFWQGLQLVFFLGQLWQRQRFARQLRQLH